MREAEIKHSRLAMLAAAGWPLSELWHQSLANTLGLDSILAAENRAPSVLNGGTYTRSNRSVFADKRLNNVI
jgi:light-harvesting complex II chlorophyll a/b binding protein 4